MDLLSNVLLSLKVKSMLISQWRMGAPWGVDTQGFEPSFCLNVISGKCWVISPNTGSVELQPGDAILAPRGCVCQIVSQPGTPLTLASKLWQQDKFPGFDHYKPAAPLSVEWPGSGTQTQLLGLAFQFHAGAHRGLLEALPRCIVLRQAQTQQYPSIESSLRNLFTDINSEAPGHFAVASNLAEHMFISQLRTHILSNSHHTTGWLKGLTDAKIAKALTAIHATPERAWQSAQLAAVAGMSRSAFAKSFSLLIGQPPIDYLNTWRINVASEKLRSSQLAISEIASQVGFQSDRVFRRIFKQKTGVSPRQYRNITR